MRQDKEIGNLLRIQMCQHQLLIGSGKHFLELPGTNYLYGDKSRIQLFWKQNTKYQIILKVQGSCNQYLEQEHDVFLIDTIYSVVR